MRTAERRSWFNILCGTVMVAIAASAVFGYHCDRAGAETVRGDAAEVGGPDVQESEAYAGNILRPGKEATDGTTAARVEPEPVIDGEAADRAVDASSDPKLRIIEAHEIATRATTESQYTRIIFLCEDGSIASLDEEIVTYARRLAAWAYNRRGETRADSGKNSEALADFDEAITYDPSCWRAIHNRGVSFAHAGALREAFDDFSRTIQLRPDHAKAYSNRAALYEQAGDLKAALDDYRLAIERDPRLAIAHAGRGRVTAQLGHIDVAQIELSEAIRLDPEDATFYLAKADLCAQMGHYEQALGNYSKAVELNPLMAEAYRNGAWLLATCPEGQFRDSENALEGAKKAIELAGTERHLFLDTLAAAQANAGDYAAAVRTATLAVEEAPVTFRAFYEQRLRLYEQEQPYRTERAPQMRRMTMPE